MLALVGDMLCYGSEKVERVEDLVKAGVIDPTKVMRIALENAASIAGLILTTECIVSEKPKKKEKTPVPGYGAGMEDY